MAGFLEFIKKNQYEELKAWAGQYEEESLQTLDTTLAWQSIVKNIFEEKKYNQNTQKIIIELLSWNNIPKCLTEETFTNNLLSRLLHATMLAYTTTPEVKNFLRFAYTILSRADINKLPEFILTDIAICCIRGATKDKNAIESFTKVFSLVLKSRPSLADKKEWDSCFSFFHDVNDHARIDVINLLSMALTQKSQIAIPFLEIILSTMLKNNEELSIMDMPFGIRQAKVPPRSLEIHHDMPTLLSYFNDNKTSSHHKKSTLDKEARILMEINPEGTTGKVIFTSPTPSGEDYVYILKKFQTTKEIYLKICNNDVLFEELISKIKTNILKDDKFFSLPPGVLAKHFANYQVSKKDATIESVKSQISLNTLNYLVRAHKDNQQINLMRERFKFDENSTVNTVLEDLNQFLGALLTNFDNNKPNTFLKNKFYETNRAILLDILQNENILTLLAERKDKLDFIDIILENLKQLSKKVSGIEKISPITIPAVFYQIHAKQVCSKYLELKKSLEDERNNKNQNNVSEFSEKRMLSKYELLSSIFMEVIDGLDTYIQAKLAEKNTESNNIITPLTPDDFADIPMLEILTAIKDKQLIELSWKDVKKIITLCQAPYDDNFNGIIKEILNKTEIIQNMYALYTAKDKSFIKCSIENAKVFNAPFSKIFIQMVLTRDNIAKLFKKEHQMHGEISLSNNNVTLYDDISIYGENFLKPLIDEINLLDKHLLPDPKGNNLFTSMINYIITDTSELLHEFIRKIMMLDTNLHNNIAMYSQWAFDSIKMLVDEENEFQIGKFVPTETKQSLRSELNILEGLCKEAKHYATMAEKEQLRQAPLASKPKLSKDKQGPPANIGQRLGKSISDLFTPKNRRSSNQDYPSLDTGLNNSHAKDSQNAL